MRGAGWGPKRWVTASTTALGRSVFQATLLVGGHEEANPAGGGDRRLTLHSVRDGAIRGDATGGAPRVVNRAEVELRNGLLLRRVELVVDESDHEELADALSLGQRRE